MGTKIGNVLELLDSWLVEARAEKKAALKSATHEGRGTTSHPVMNVDDGTVPAKEGTRAKENDSDIRKAYGDAGNSGQRDAASASSAQPSDNMGTQKMDASEVKGNVPTPKATPEPLGTGGRGDASPGHPTNATFREKYSSAIQRGSSLLARIASLGVQSTAPAETPPAVKTAESAPSETGQPATAPPPPLPTDPVSASTEAKRAAAAKYPDDAAAGYLAAERLAAELGFDKQAAEDADALVESQLESVVKAAQEDAVRYVQFFQSFLDEQQQVKSAEGLPPELLEAAAGGAPEGVPAEAELPPEALAEAGVGGGEAGAGGVDEDAILDALAEALDEYGVTPEQLAQALVEAQADEGAAGAEPYAGAETPAEEAAEAKMPPPERKGKEPEKEAMLKKRAAEILQTARKRNLREVVRAATAA